MEPEAVLIRHATTVDTRAGLFSGRGATPLDEPGRQQADALARSIGDREWGDVLVSPVARAWETAERAGLGARARACDALVEWDYGELTGRNNIEVRRAEPGWNLFVDGAPGGEHPDDVADRLQPLLDSLRSSADDTVGQGARKSLPPARRTASTAFHRPRRDACSIDGRSRQR